MALKTGGVRHYTLTFADGNPVNLATFLIAGGLLSAAEDGPYQQVTLYAGDGNSTRIVYVGGDSSLSSTDYGVALDTEETFTFAPVFTGIRLRDIWLLGTAADTVHVIALPF